MNLSDGFIIKRLSVFKIILSEGSSRVTAAVRILFPTPACGNEVVARSRLVVLFGQANVTSQQWDCRRICPIGANNVYFSPVVERTAIIGNGV